MKLGAFVISNVEIRYRKRVVPIEVK